MRAAVTETKGQRTTFVETNVLIGNAHRDWRFRTGLVLMLAAMALYVGSDNLALLPRH